MFKLEYCIVRVCNNPDRDGGYSKLDSLKSSPSIQGSRPVEDSSAESQVELQIAYSITQDQVSAVARQDALKSIREWCEDPCPKCGALASDGGISVVQIDAK